jgi:hypothetical protein
MSENFIREVQTSGKARDVSELPIGITGEASHINMIIPECCREGWASCPHVLKKHKPAKRNVGL